ncbi:recombinase family protein [Sphingobium aromaticiconvertens]|uniref:recombinase family protein n=1 Tax=Sphingobium aromaticiconvertens TaxID=365341 RepID=UPI00301746E5
MARPRSAASRYKHRKNNDHLKVREAVLYARVSTPEQQREGYSIPAQVKLLEDYAALNGIAVVSSHVDVETARKSGRTAFGNMLRYLRRHPEVRIILVEKTDRLYRNLKDWATIDDLGVEVHFVKENVVMSEGCRSSEKFVHGIKVLMAKAYIDNLSEETRKGMIEKAQQGHWPSCAPIGYRNVRDGQGRNVITIDPEAGPIVTRLFDWYATGLYSLKEVTVMARNAGMRYRRSGRPVGVSTVHGMLRNRLYAGTFEWRGEIYAGTHEPLISTDIWEAVQQTLDERSSANIRAKPHFFPFTGLIKCGHCGCALVAQMQKGKYIYYRCSGFRGRCPERFVRQEALEEHFLELLAKLRCGRDQFEEIRNAIDPDCLEDGDDEINVASLRHRSATAGMPGALLDAGLALLNMGRSLHLRLPGLPDEMKRQMLGLVFQRCSWANGALTGAFNPPFDIFAGHLAARGGAASIGLLLSKLFLRATPDVRLLIARYNAMERVRLAGTDDNPIVPGIEWGGSSLSEALPLAA